MFKRFVLTGTVVVFMILAAACSSQAPAAAESPVIAQDIMLGADDAAEPDIPTPAAFDTAEKDNEALSDQKEYLQKQIDALNEKIENLQWLRDSYDEQNPADLITKLAECDALIADAQAELTSLQNRMTQNEQNLGISNSNEPSVSPEDIQPEAPSETPIESQEPTPEESVPVS